MYLPFNLGIGRESKAKQPRHHRALKHLTSSEHRLGADVQPITYLSPTAILTP